MNAFVKHYILFMEKITVFKVIKLFIATTYAYRIPNM